MLMITWDKIYFYVPHARLNLIIKSSNLAYLKYLTVYLILKCINKHVLLKEYLGFSTFALAFDVLEEYDLKKYDNKIK